MTEDKSSAKPSINVEGDVKGNIIVGDGNVITTIRNYVFRDTKQLIVFSIIFLLIIGGITGAYWYSKQPAIMTGNFNIAVAQFGEIKENGTVSPSARAEKISSVLFNFLQSEYQVSGLGLTVQVAHKNMPLITEDVEAEILAKKVNADIVIYGNVYAQGDQAEFAPRFYVAERPDTKELTGQNELALPIEFRISELGTQDAVNKQLRTQTKILFNFTKALIYFSQKDLDSALRSVQTTIASTEELLNPFAGEEVIYLLASQIYTNRKEYDTANEMLDEALVLNPQYARARLARGNILYFQAVEANLDPGLLDEAQAEYMLAYQMPNQPEGAYIPIKARASLGNTLVVKAQQTNDPELFAQAFEHYTYVTEAYKRTKDPFLASYASVAYFGIGVIYERQGKTEQAIEAYQQAYDLSDDTDFKARIENQIKALQGQ